jgi:hypothetical protein
MNLKNNWKSLPCFLKGGLIGLILTIIYSSIIYSIIKANGLDANNMSFFSSWLMMPLMGEYFPFSLMFCLILYSALGMLVGFVYGLIKS